ncbi:MAG: family transposase [Gemmataceae bacterium]|nr:family transposase [Gemmataceae bacterium]
MAEARRTFTREFKVAAVKLVTGKGRSGSEVARSPGIGTELLRRWKIALDTGGREAFPGHGSLPPAEDELRGLKAEGARLKAERDILQNSYGALRQEVAVSHAFIESHRAEWPVAPMGDALGVSTPGDYSWRDRAASDRQQRRDALTAEIHAVRVAVKARSGSPRMHPEMVDRGRHCCVITVARIMRAAGIVTKTKRKFRHTTDANHTRPVAETGPCRV